MIGNTNIFQNHKIPESILHSTTEQSSSPKTASTLTEPDIEAYASGYKTFNTDITYRQYKPSKGTIPKDLIGTYYRVGPSMYTSGSLINEKNKEVVEDGSDIDRMVKHPFDGDGAILGLTFHKDDVEQADDDIMTMRYRYVRTVGFKSENRKHRKLYTGMESTRLNAKDTIMNDYPIPFGRYHLQPGINKNRKNISNTRPIFWSNKLFTTFEGALPYKLDHIALGTEGKSQFGGILKKNTPLGNKACYDPIQKRIVFYANNNNDSKSATLTLYEFNANFQLEYEKEVKLNTGFMMIYDFALTKDYSIFIQPAVNVNGMQFMLSKEPGKTLSLDDQGGTSYVHLIPRDESSPARSIPLPKSSISFANIQIANAYQNENTIIIDFIASDKESSKQSSSSSYPWFTSLQSFQDKTTKKSLWRLTLNNQNNDSIESSLTCLTKKQVSFPTIQPEEHTVAHTYIYMNVGGLDEEKAPPQGILKYNALEGKIEEEWIPENYEFCGEPIYCPSSTTKEQGYILSILYNGKTKSSSILLFDSTNLSQGPITIIPLEDEVLPHGYHGLFSTDVDFNTDEIERRCKLAEKMERRSNMWNEVKSDFSGLGLRLDDEDFDLEEFFK